MLASFPSVIKEKNTICHVMSAGQIFNNFCYYIHTYIILLLLQFITKNGVILIINLLINYFNLLYKSTILLLEKSKVHQEI